MRHPDAWDHHQLTVGVDRLATHMPEILDAARIMTTPQSAKRAWATRKGGAPVERKLVPARPDPVPYENLDAQFNRTPQGWYTHNGEVLVQRGFVGTHEGIVEDNIDKLAPEARDLPRDTNELEFMHPARQAQKSGWLRLLYHREVVGVELLNTRETLERAKAFLWKHGGPRGVTLDIINPKDRKLDHSQDFDDVQGAIKHLDRLLAGARPGRSQTARFLTTPASAKRAWVTRKGGAAVEDDPNTIYPRTDPRPPGSPRQHLMLPDESGKPVAVLVGPASALEAPAEWLHSVAAVSIARNQAAVAAADDVLHEDLLDEFSLDVPERDTFAHVEVQRGRRFGASDQWPGVRIVPPATQDAREEVRVMNRVKAWVEQAYHLRSGKYEFEPIWQHIENYEDPQQREWMRPILARNMTTPQSAKRSWVTRKGGPPADTKSTGRPLPKEIKARPIDDLKQVAHLPKYRAVIDVEGGTFAYSTDFANIIHPVLMNEAYPSRNQNDFARVIAQGDRLSIYMPDSRTPAQELDRYRSLERMLARAGVLRQGVALKIEWAFPENRDTATYTTSASAKRAWATRKGAPPVSDDPHLFEATRRIGRNESVGFWLRNDGKTLSFFETRQHLQVLLDSPDPPEAWGLRWQDLSSLRKVLPFGRKLPALVRQHFEPALANNIRVRVWDRNNLEIEVFSPVSPKSFARMQHLVGALPLPDATRLVLIGKKEFAETTVQDFLFGASWSEFVRPVTPFVRTHATRLEVYDRAAALKAWETRRAKGFVPKGKPETPSPPHKPESAFTPQEQRAFEVWEDKVDLVAKENGPLTPTDKAVFLASNHGNFLKLDGFATKGIGRMRGAKDPQTFDKELAGLWALHDSVLDIEYGTERIRAAGELIGKYYAFVQRYPEAKLPTFKTIPGPREGSVMILHGALVRVSGWNLSITHPTTRPYTTPASAKRAWITRKGGSAVVDEKKGRKPGKAEPEPTKSKAKTLPAITGLRKVKKRAWSWEPVESQIALTKPQQGDLGEAIVISYLKASGFQDADTLNFGRNNFAMDLVHDHEVIEVKTGMASNTSDAQKWRVTLGEPGPKEKQWLKTATPEQKAQHNAKKAVAAMERKMKAIREVERKTKGKLKFSTLCLIVNADTKTADLYRFQRLHGAIRWRSPKAQQGYVGSVQYAGGHALVASVAQYTSEAARKAWETRQAQWAADYKAHKWGSVQVDLPPDIAARVLALANSIPDSDLAGEGREAKPHVTVRYGILFDRMAQVQQYLETVKSFEVELGRTGTFPPSEHSDNAGVVWVEALADELHWLFDGLGHTGAFKPANFEYHPHITLAYVDPEQAEQYADRTDLEGVRFTVTKVTLSNPDELRITVSLKPQDVPTLRKESAMQSAHVIRAYTSEAARKAWETRKANGWVPKSKKQSVAPAPTVHVPPPGHPVTPPPNTKGMPADLKKVKAAMTSQERRAFEVWLGRANNTVYGQEHENAFREGEIAVFLSQNNNDYLKLNDFPVRGIGKAYGVKKPEEFDEDLSKLWALHDVTLGLDGSKRDASSRNLVRSYLAFRTKYAPPRSEVLLPNIKDTWDFAEDALMRSHDTLARISGWNLSLVHKTSRVYRYYQRWEIPQ